MESYSISVNIVEQYQSYLVNKYKVEIEDFLAGLCDFYHTQNSDYNYQLAHPGFEQFKSTIREYLTANNFAQWKILKAS